MTSEESEGPTPAGGVRSVIHYLDDSGRPAEKDEATGARILEYDAGGALLQTTYASLGRPSGSPASPPPSPPKE